MVLLFGQFPFGFRDDAPQVPSTASVDLLEPTTDGQRVTHRRLWGKWQHYSDVTWAPWRLKLHLTRLFQANVNKKNQRDYWLFVTGSNRGDHWIPLPKRQPRGKLFHVMTSSCRLPYNQWIRFVQIYYNVHFSDWFPLILHKKKWFFHSLIIHHWIMITFISN